MLLAERKTIIILAPHTDDGEMGCGGTISKYSEKGSYIYYVAFSTCNNPALEDEMRKATDFLKVKKVILFDFQFRRFNEFRKDILQEMVNLMEDIKPDCVYTPALEDMHQDHSVVTEEAIRAFKRCSILSYELPWNNISFNTGYFEKLEERQIEDKCTALSFYKSQRHRNYMNNEFVCSLARVRGTQINTRYAEAFQVIRIIK